MPVGGDQVVRGLDQRAQQWQPTDQGQRAEGRNPAIRSIASPPATQRPWASTTCMEASSCSWLGAAGRRDAAAWSGTRRSRRRRSRRRRTRAVRLQNPQSASYRLVSGRLVIALSLDRSLAPRQARGVTSAASAARRLGAAPESARARPQQLVAPLDLQHWPTSTSYAAYTRWRPRWRPRWRRKSWPTLCASMPKHTFAALRFVRHGRADPLPSTASVATKVGVAAEQAD